MRAAPVIAVVVINDPKAAVLLARALVGGGLPAIEITLRTPNALACIKAVADEVEGAICGAGTVLDYQQIMAVEQAGAKFMVSPGASPNLLLAADDTPVALLPGAVTPSQMMALGEIGYTHLKFFPAAAAGGVNYLKSMASVLPQFQFCPTGGINALNAAEYLALPNVLCVGGSWVAPVDMIEAGNWTGIKKLARKAATFTT